MKLAVQCFFVVKPPFVFKNKQVIKEKKATKTVSSNVEFHLYFAETRETATCKINQQNFCKIVFQKNFCKKLLQKEKLTEKTCTKKKR
jgi:hypothetical protein